MYTQNNPYYPTHDFPRTWSADDLAAAVPLRLSDRVSLGLVQFGPMPRPANASGPAAPQHCLYLRPDPQGHGSLRPTFGASRRTVPTSRESRAAARRSAANRW